MRRGSTFFGGRRGGKVLWTAFEAAAALRRGENVVSVSRDPETGETRFEKVVAVPGFPDGTQIEGKR